MPIAAQRRVKTCYFETLFAKLHVASEEKAASRWILIIQAGSFSVLFFAHYSLSFGCAGGDQMLDRGNQFFFEISRAPNFQEGDLSCLIDDHRLR